MKNTALEQEHLFLDTVYRTYPLDNSLQANAMRRLTMRTFKPFLKRGRALELGCWDGSMTEMIARQVGNLHVVDGSRKFLRKASQRPLPNVEFFYSLFETFRSKQKYDYVFGSYILEHVLDPLAVLKVAASVLKPTGLLFIVVPNARALSRQLALHMDLLKDLKGLTQNDHDHGHRRVYDRVSLNKDLEAAGFETISQGGILFKLLADFQLDDLFQRGVLKEEHTEGLYRLGLEYPDFCGSLFSICRLKK